jgi:hypothetical protein
MRKGRFDTAKRHSLCPSVKGETISTFPLAGANITNRLVFGGGGMSIESEHANVSLSRLRIANNTAEWRGSGIYNTGYLIVSECVFEADILPKMRWESAYGTSYEIKVSDDASNWTTIHSATNGNGNLDDLSVSGRGRYVKMRGVQRGTTYGYSLYEFEAYGK